MTDKKRTIINIVCKSCGELAFYSIEQGISKCFNCGHHQVDKRSDTASKKEDNTP